MELVLFVVNMVLSLQPVVNSHTYEPTISYVRTFPHPNCTIDDPLGPCEDEELLAVNPTLHDVLMDISCGTDRDEQFVMVPSRSQLKLLIQLTIPSYTHPMCELVDWK